MIPTPVSRNIVDEIKLNSGIDNIGKASIREIVKVVNLIEEQTGVKFIRMEMGVPGLPPSRVGTDAEIAALKLGVASQYPMIDGHPPLKKEASRFAKLFLDIDVSPECCIPTVGSMMGAMAAFMVVNRSDRNKEGTLFLDPGFPVQKQQCLVLGHEYKSFDIYDYRGEKLKDKLETYLKTGKISSILYSNPNNPSWVCLNDYELRIIAEMADKYDVVVIEDLAYFGMDFGNDISKPGEPPYQPTVAKYTDNYLLLVSSSKVFSYAGQRVGMMIISEKLFNRHYPDLKRFYTSEIFGRAMIYGALYALSSGTSHSAQYALAAIYKAVNDGEYNFIDDVRDYEEKAAVMKKMFKDNGFSIVYDKDLDKPIADGFYFTISYPGLQGPELLEEFLYYGISAISLAITGSSRTEGLRACVSQVKREQFNDLEKRLKAFKENHSKID